jgi:glutamate dehydrogenase
MTPSPLSDLMAFAREHGGPAANTMVDFSAAYFDKADPEELLARGPATLFAIAKAHWRLMESARPKQGAKVRVFNPTLAEDGFISEHTAVQIVHDDMPFLVDSVTMAVNRNGRTAHWIVHPIMGVQRDGDGAFVTAANAHIGGTDAMESLILVECDRILSAEHRDALAADLTQVLADVRAAVQDWRPMVERLHAVGAAAADSPLSAERRQEGIAFLNWLEDRNFTFLGARDYDVVRSGDTVHLQAIEGSGLVLLRGAPKTTTSVLPPDALELLDKDQLVLVTKAMTRSTVHRPAWLDYLAVKRFNAAGQLVGEARFLGLYTSTAYSARVEDIPEVRRRAKNVMAAAGVLPDSHTAKSLQAIFGAYPRDELFQIDTATLTEHAIGILRLQERQRTRVFLRHDPYGRFTSALVFVPREHFNTELRTKVGQALMAALQGQSIEFTPMLTDSPLARIHYLVIAKGRAPQVVDLRALEDRIARLAQRWEDDCTAELLRTHGEGHGLELAHRFANVFSVAYREDFSPAVAAEDAGVLASLSESTPLVVRLYRPLDAEPGLLRFKIYNTAKMALSDSLPVLEHMGARVMD